MAEVTEQTIIEQVVERLAARYPAVAPDTIAAVVARIYARFDGRPVRDYVPLFVERGAGAELAGLGG